jgi:formate hydrogenlyase subunit 4
VIFIDLLQLVALVVMPFLITGAIVRVKSVWAGRKGPPLLQPGYDFLRLLRKSPVFSLDTGPVFRLAPVVGLVTALASATLVPLLGTTALVSFRFDFVWLAYAWTLGRVALTLAALDTGSSFEGMGAAREAGFAVALEPALFLIVTALCALSQSDSLSGALALSLDDGPATVAWIAAVVGLMVVLQVEAARMPVDDPSTHLELTMTHEVMALDHSGPQLALIQFASAVKLLVCASLIATLLNPWAGSVSLRSVLAQLAGYAVVIVTVGSVESLTARLRLRTVPQYIAIAVAAGAVALLATAWKAAPHV